MAAPLQTAGGEALATTTVASNEHVEQYAGLQERLYNCETSGAWDEADYKGVIALLSGADVTKMIMLRSIELAAKYSRHFPALSQQVFQDIVGKFEGKDPSDVQASSIKAQFMKHAEGFLKAPEEGRNEVVANHAPVLLQKMFEAQPEKHQFAADLLEKMVNADPKAVSIGCSELLQSESTTTNEQWREYVLNFFMKNILVQHKKTLAASPQAEAAIKDEITKLLAEVCKKEFKILLDGLTGLKIAGNKELFGPQGVVDTLSSLIDTKADVDLTVNWQVERTLSIISHAVPFLGKGCCDTVFTPYLINSWITPEGVFAKASGTHSVQILQRLCDVVPHCKDEAAADLIQPLYTTAMGYIVARPAEGEGQQAEDVNFSLVEGFLFALEALGRKAQDKFAEVTGVKVKENLATAKKAAASSIKTNEEIAAEKPFKDRMRYLQENTSKILLQLTHAKNQLASSTVANKDEKLKQIADAIPNLQSVSHLCKPLSESYPYFPSQNALSWQQESRKRSRGNDNDDRQSALKKQKPDPKSGQAQKGSKRKGGKGGKGGKGSKGGKGGKK